MLKLSSSIRYKVYPANNKLLQLLEKDMWINYYFSKKTKYSGHLIIHSKTISMKIGLEEYNCMKSSKEIS